MQDNIAAMVEVNCETDFVARNNTFTEFVDSVTKACAAHVAQMPSNNGAALSKINFDADTLKSITLNDGKSLSDHLALIIGKVGENASLRRATCFRSTDMRTTLAAFTHPPVKNTKAAVQMGKFGAIVAVQGTSATTATELKRNICQHIVGMNPQQIGNIDVDKPTESKDDETCLIWQEYLLEPSITVGELLAENNIEIVDFHRFECGEIIAATAADQNEDFSKEAVINN